MILKFIYCKYKENFLLLWNYRIIHYIQLFQIQDIGLATCWSWVILKSPKTLSVCKKWACDGKERESEEPEHRNWAAPPTL